MVYLVDVAVCSLNQWALDFTGNRDRIIRSISQAASYGCKYRSGPELEIPGYSCQDHFFEPDTEQHCWEMLAQIIDASPDDMMIDVGLPVTLRGVRYNCRLVYINKRIVLIRPKTVLANDHNYREQRWFTGYKSNGEVDSIELPKCVQKVCSNQRSAPFGLGFLKLADNIRVGYEICEELWAPQSVAIDQSLIQKKLKIRIYIFTQLYFHFAQKYRRSLNLSHAACHQDEDISFFLQL